VFEVEFVVAGLFMLLMFPVLLLVLLLVLLVDGEALVVVVVFVVVVVVVVELPLVDVVVVLLVELPATFVFDSPGQAAPNKPNVKTAERAITFFISIKFSCLLQRMLFLLYCLTTFLRKSCPSNIFSEHWTI
jgi:hypothetical protein